MSMREATLVEKIIFEGDKNIIPLTEVQHIEKDTREGYEGNIRVIMKSTRYNLKEDYWENFIYLQEEEANQFLEIWANFRLIKDKAQ